VIGEGNHESDYEDFLFEHKHRKIRQIFLHTSKTMAINNLETLIPWSRWIQDDLYLKHHA
jgi:hypothetical protein